MTQIINPAADAALPITPVAAAAPRPAPVKAAPLPGPDPANLRLVIEDDHAAGCFVYKTVDWRTGEVVQQLPREELVKLREANAYLAGDVIRTEA
jgi:flagellar protein FlaG